jgi:hypothetical protein
VADSNWEDETLVDERKIAVGERVRFTRSHDRQSLLVGIVTVVTDDEVLVETEPDSVLVWAAWADVALV